MSTGSNKNTGQNKTAVQNKNSAESNKTQARASGPGQYKMSSERGEANVVAKAEACVGDYPVSSVLLVFGIGLGVGVAIASILASPAASPPTFGQRAEVAAEKLGRQMLDAMACVLPQSLAKHVS